MLAGRERRSCTSLAGGQLPGSPPERPPATESSFVAASPLQSQLLMTPTTARKTADPDEPSLHEHDRLLPGTHDGRLARRPLANEPALVTTIAKPQPPTRTGFCVGLRARISCSEGTPCCLLPSKFGAMVPVCKSPMISGAVAGGRAVSGAQWSWSEPISSLGRKTTGAALCAQRSHPPYLGCAATTRRRVAGAVRRRWVVGDAARRTDAPACRRV